MNISDMSLVAEIQYVSELLSFFNHRTNKMSPSFIVLQMFTWTQFARFDIFCPLIRSDLSEFFSGARTWWV